MAKKDEDDFDADGLEALVEWLLEMEIDEMCEELGITKEDILNRSKKQVYAYYQGMDRTYQRDLSRGLSEEGEYYDEEEDRLEEELSEFMHIIEDEV